MPCVVCGEYVPRGKTRCVRGHYQLATCPFCGTDRLRSVPICAECGNAWIDTPYESEEEVVVGRPWEDNTKT